MTKFGRREFLRAVGAEALRSIIPPEKQPLDWNPVVVRPGDTLCELCDFFGIPNFRPVALHNQLKNWDLIRSGSRILLPLSEDEITLPFFGLNIPGVFEWLAITTGNYGQWCSGSDPTSDFAYMDNTQKPYLIEGHSQQGNYLNGPFGMLRKLELSDKVNILRKRDERWIKGVISGIITTESDRSVLNRLNSRTLALITCKTETKNLKDSLVYFVKVTDYYGEI